MAKFTGSNQGGGQLSAKGMAFMTALIDTIQKLRKAADILGEIETFERI